MAISGVCFGAAQRLDDLGARWLPLGGFGLHCSLCFAFCSHLVTFLNGPRMDLTSLVILYSAILADFPATEGKLFG